jgi:hypothetical protein
VSCRAGLDGMEKRKKLYSFLESNPDRPSCNPWWLKKINSVAVVRKRTIPTERPPLVGEVSANFGGVEGVAW